jgi:acetylornithine/succinyldiaminopimelate/putrescine aminotransferase
VTHKLKDTPSEVEKTISLANEHVLPVYSRPHDIIISHGKGSYLHTVGGLQYLDFGSGIAVNAIGHADKEYLEVCYSPSLGQNY